MSTYKQYIVTEHRQIVVSSDRGMRESDAFRIALSGDQPSHVISDNITRNIYPVQGTEIDDA